MTFFADLFSVLPGQRLGWTLLHSLWQFAVIGLCLWITLSLLRRRSANLRYLVSCGALAVALVLSAVTFFLLPGAPESSRPVAASDARPFVVMVPEPPQTAGAATPLQQNEVPITAPRVVTDEENLAADTSDEERAVPWRIALEKSLEPWMPWLAMAWLFGVAALSVRNLGGWIGVRRLRHVGTASVGAGLALCVQSLVARMKISRPVRILQSALVEVPIVVGWLKPVILLPAGILSGLSPEQLEAVLAHELAHIRRHDYLVNLLQTVLETLFFYHPAVWWMSRRIRIEREHCCDDAAVAICGDGIGLGEALTLLATARLNLRPAIAASGGSLVTRVRRILTRQPEGPDRRHAWLAGAILTGLILASTLVLGGAAKQSSEADSQVEVAFWQAIVDETTAEQLLGENALTPKSFEQGVTIESDRLLEGLRAMGKKISLPHIVSRLYWAQQSTPIQKQLDSPRILSMCDSTRIPDREDRPGDRSYNAFWNATVFYRLDSTKNSARIDIDQFQSVPTFQIYTKTEGFTNFDAATSGFQKKISRQVPAGRALVFPALLKGKTNQKFYTLLIAQAVAVPKDQSDYVRAYTDTKKWIAGGPERAFDEIRAARHWETQTGAAKETVIPAGAEYQTPDDLNIKIVAIGRPGRWPYHWWNAEGVPIHGDPQWQQYAGSALLTLVLEIKNPAGHLDFSWNMPDYRGDLKGMNLLGYSNFPDEDKMHCILSIGNADPLYREIQDYLDNNGQVEIAVRHGTGKWTQIAILKEGQEVEADEGRFHLKEVKKIFGKEVNKTGTILVDGDYDYDPVAEIMLAAVDKQGHRTLLGGGVGSGNFDHRDKHRWYANLPVDKPDIDHFAVLKRPLTEHVFKQIAVAPKVLPDASSIQPKTVIIEDIIRGAPVSTDFENLEIFEKTPGMAGEYRIRPAIVRTQVTTDLSPVECFFLPDKNVYYLQYDLPGSSTLHYYGPFQGNPKNIVFKKQESTSASPWGTPVEDVQCRLRLEKSVWKVGETPQIIVDLRNRGQRQFVLNRYPNMFPTPWKIRYDGVWYRATINIGTPVLSMDLKPGDEKLDVHLWPDRLVLDPLWAWRSVDGDQPLEFKPGKHAIHIAIPLNAQETGGIVVESRPVEFEIVEKDAAKQPAVKPANPKPAQTIIEGDFALDKDLPLEINLPAGDQPNILQIKAIRFTNKLLREDTQIEVQKIDAKLSGQIVSWPKGKWRIETAVLDAAGKILTKDEKTIENGGVVIGVAEIGPFEQTFELGSAGKWLPLAKRFRVTILDPAESGWGKPVEGVQCRLRPEKSVWKTGQTPKILADLRNQGKNIVIRDISTIPGPWEIQFDDVWYRPTVKFDTNTKSTRLNIAPGGHQDGIPLRLDDTFKWKSKEGGRPLEFTPGKHTLKAVFSLQTADKRTSQFESNPVEIEIVEKDAADQPAQIDANPEPARTFIESDFSMDKDIPVEISLPAGDVSNVLQIKTIRFAYNKLRYEDTEIEVQKIDAKLTGKIVSWPKGKWRIETAVLDARGKILAKDEKSIENKGTILGDSLIGPFELTFDIGSAEKLLPLAKRFRVTILDPAEKVDDVPAKSSAPPNARQTIEKYVAAALAGKIDEAMALAVEGTGPASRKQIGQFKQLVGIGTLPIQTVVASEAKNWAVAVLGKVKISPPNPDGRDTGLLWFELERRDGKWLLRDIDFDPEKKAGEKLKEFKKNHPDAIEVPADNESAWGKAVEGVQCRLRPEKSVLKVGETPQIMADLRNRGKNAVIRDVSRTPGDWDIQFDDEWYHPTMKLSSSSSRASHRLNMTPGGSETGVKLSLNLGFKWVNTGGDRWLVFTPGKHTLRAVFRLQTADHRVLQVESNPVEIEIVEEDAPKSRSIDQPNKEKKSGRFIEGRMTDADGRPIAGALVEWGYMGAIFDPPEKMQRTHTDAEGRYRLELDRYGVSYGLGVSAPGMAPQWNVFYAGWNMMGDLRISDEQAIPPEKADFQLEPAHWIQGVVVDRADRPIPGVKIEAQTAVTGFHSSFCMPSPSRPIPGGKYETVTGPDGTFVLKGLPAEEVQLCVRSPHRHVNDGNYTVDHDHRIEMSGSGRPGVLRARVIDRKTGKPVPEFIVANRYESKTRAFKSPDGRFQWKDDVTEGSIYSVSIYSKGYSPNTAEIQAEPADGGETETIELTPARPLLGQLLDAQTGKPLAGVPVLYAVPAEGRGVHNVFEWPDGKNYIGSFSLVQRAVTDAQGGFWFSEEVKGAKGTLFALAPGYGRLVLKPQDRPRAADDQPVAIKLYPEAAVSGVLLKDGRPQAGLDVTIRKADSEMELDEWFETVKTDAHGRFHLANLASGQYQVFLWTHPSRDVSVPKNIQKITLDRGEQKVFEPMQIESEPAKKSPSVVPSLFLKQPPKPEKPAPVNYTPIQVSGQVVDDATGKPVQNFVVQNGQVDKKNPLKIQWGFGEQRTTSANPQGRYSTTINWDAGWRARIVAEGYAPQPIFDQPPDPAALRIENRTVRLKRGGVVQGRVLDSEGKPVEGARVFFRRPGSLTVENGQINEEGPGKTIVRTDKEGRFTIAGGGDEASQIIVLAPRLNAWCVPAPKEGSTEEFVIRLPKPATLKVIVDIPGAVQENEQHTTSRGGKIQSADKKVFFRMELKTWDMEGWKSVGNFIETRSAANPGEVVFENLAPGIYDFIRYRMFFLGDQGRSAFCDRQDVILQPGETKTIHLVRERGQRINGQIVGLPKDVPGAFIKILPPEATGDPAKHDEWKLPVFDALTAVPGKPFTTSLLVPGQYKIIAEAYQPEPKTGTWHSGWRLPAFIGTALVTVENNDPATPKKPAPNVTIQMKLRRDEAVKESRLQENKPPDSAADPLNIKTDTKKIPRETKTSDNNRQMSFNASYKHVPGQSPELHLQINGNPFQFTSGLFEKDDADKSNREELKSGRSVRGRLLNHEGKPVENASIAWNWGPDAVHTDQNGRFQINVGKDADHLIVSAPPLDHLSVPLPTEESKEELTIRLPQPATLKVIVDIPGAVQSNEQRVVGSPWDLAPADQKISFYLHLFCLPKQKDGMSNGRNHVDNYTIANPGEMEIKNLLPGFYDFSREESFNLGGQAKGFFCDRQDINLAPGETKTIRLVRKRGQQIDGRIRGLPKDVPGAFIKIHPISASGDPRKQNRQWILPTFDALTCAPDGKFRTSMLAPGQYKISAEAYRLIPQEDATHFAKRLPDFVGTADVTVEDDDFADPKKPAPQVAVEMKSYNSQGTGVVSGIRAVLPQGWECSLHNEAGKMGSLYGLDEPAFRIDLINPSQFFADPWPPDPTRRTHPRLRLFFYSIATKQRILKTMDAQQMSSRGDIPWYCAETKDYMVLTSPEDINGGRFSGDAGKLLDPLDRALTVYFSRLKPNDGSPPRLTVLPFLYASGMPFELEKTASRNPVKPGKSEPGAAVGPWCEPINGLTGRLIAAKKKISLPECFDVKLELKNVGSSAVAVKTDDPGTLNVQVKDMGGYPVETFWGRLDVIIPIKWIVLSPGQTTSYMVSSRRSDVRDAQLDVLTKIWQLLPGKYTLHIRYSSKNVVDPKHPENAWKGDIALAPIDLEVVGQPAQPPKIEHPPADVRPKADRESIQEKPKEQKKEPEEKLSLEVRILGVDGKPVDRSSITVWKSVAPDDLKKLREEARPFPGEDHPAVWTDTLAGKTWKPIGHTAADNKIVDENLAPGEYRVTAFEGHNYPATIGVSDVIVLDGGRKLTTVTVPLEKGPSLHIQPVDQQTGKPVDHCAIRLIRPDGLPIVGWSGAWQIRADGKDYTFKHLAPGDYRLEVEKRAFFYGEPDYRTADRSTEKLRIEPDKNLDLKIPLRASYPDEKEAEQRWPWAVSGSVTTADGKPVEGAEVWVSCGMGTLWPTARTKTDANGKYLLRFSSGMRSWNEKEKRWEAGLQAALVSVSKPGYHEKNQHRQGDLRMADTMPPKDNVWGAKPDQVVLPHKPFQLDFVMVPDADKKPAPSDAKEESKRPWNVAGTVKYADGKPVEGATVNAYSGSGTLRRTGQATTDARGNYLVRFLPGYANLLPKGKTWPEGVELQAVTVSVSKSGYFEKDLNRQGDLLTMAGEMPPKDNAWNVAPEKVILPHKPYRIDFIMVPATAIEGRLLDAQGNPFADQKLSVFTAETGRSNGFSLDAKTDAQGRFKFEELPPNHPLKFYSEGAATAPMSFGDKRNEIILKFSPAQAGGKPSLVIEKKTDENKQTKKPPANAESERLLNEFRQTYALRDDQIVKRVAPPFTPGRLEYYRVHDAEQAKILPEGPETMMFWWGEDKSKVPNPRREGMIALADMGWIGKKGRSVADLVNAVTSVPYQGENSGIRPYEMLGDRKLMQNRIHGDWVVRMDVPPEKLLQGLETVLQKECNVPVRFRLSEQERKVIVAEGKYSYHPLPGNAEYTDEAYIPWDRIDVFETDRGKLLEEGGGKLDDVFDVVGLFINRPVINEALQLPKNPVCWRWSARRFNESREQNNVDEAAILKHLSAQTSLTFTEKSRRVRVLLVERVE